MSTLKPKEITVSSSKSIEFGEFKSSVAIVLEIPGEKTWEDVELDAAQYQQHCDQLVELGLQDQVRRKQQRKEANAKTKREAV